MMRIESLVAFYRYTLKFQKFVMLYFKFSIFFLIDRDNFIKKILETKPVCRSFFLPVLKKIFSKNIHSLMFKTVAAAPLVSRGGRAAKYTKTVSEF